ncbi:AhpC/TSA family protein [Cellulophaga sp. 20_2_10]|uniref:TlpA family protein disulfide reductase n=1 Tax=Cellulophaga sp. 20_2_10 TaxID=2942476 RepID=UPI00201A80E0|nr:TlpA disulfide reductase family protein [Cellulophaga sp. 20_2_10]MCL5246672.1 AhpC/TSA family protein [Cellulophaga sp. 20_2_10]
MKKLLPLLLVLITTVISAQHTISGTFSPAKEYTWLIAYQLKPGTQVYVADTKIEDGKFSIEMPANAAPGTYRLVYAVPQEEFNFDILYSGKEDIVLNFNAQDGATYTTSEENKTLNSYFLEINALQKQVIDFYTSSSTDKKELAKLYSKIESTQAKYEADAKDLIALHFIKANKPYIAKSDETIYDFVENKKQNYFTAIDFKNTNLQASSFLTDKTLNYVFTSLPLNKITKSATESILQQNIKTVASKLDGVQETFKFSLYYDLWIYAASAQYDETSDFIYANYIKKLGDITNNQELIKSIETHSRLRIGAKAPEITWNNDKNSLSKLEAAANYVVIFWSSTCSHCLKELPELNKVMKEYPNVKVLAVGLEDEYNYWDTESAKLGNFTHALALGKWDSKYADLYNVSATPSYYILDKDKKIVNKPETYKDVIAYLKK